MLGTKQSNSAKPAPISKHPAFPAVVALWFAALLGIGTMVMPAALFESAVTATGISSVVEAAAPPLGFTARAIIAVTAALIGAAVGIFVARKVAGAQAPVQGRAYQAMRAKTEASEHDEPVRAPISAHEELGSEGLDEPVEEPAPAPTNYGGRRRALAVTDDSGPSDFFESAPLPGGDAAFEESSDEAAPAEPAEEERPVEPLELADLAMDEIADEPAAMETEEPEIPAPFSAPMESAADEATARPFDAPASDLELAATPRPFDGPAPEATPDVAEATDFEALKNAVAAQAMPEAPEQPAMISNEDDSEMNHTPSDFGGSDYNPFANRISEEPQTPESFDEPVEEAPVAAPMAAPPAPNAPVGDRPLNELGVAELVERFALALQTKADAPAEPAAAEANEPEAAPMVFRRANAVSETPAEPVPATTASVAVPDAERDDVGFAPAFVPAALQPFGDDEIEEFDDEDAIPNLSLSFAARPFEKPAEPQPFAPPAEIVPEEVSEDDAAYSSLLSMKSQLSAKQEFVRIDDEDSDEMVSHGHEPAVIFPGQEQQRAGLEASQQQPEAKPAPRPFDAPHSAPATGSAAANKPAANASDTERALREALEKLQKMSGAA